MIIRSKIVSIEPHSNADRLSVCQVDVGQPEPLQVVTNLELHAGDEIPLALIGHQMPAGHEVGRIRRARIRGIESEGMFVTEDEAFALGMAEPNWASSAIGGVLVTDAPIAEVDVPEDTFQKINEIENGFQLELHAFTGREVVVMEKMDGSSHRVGFRDGRAWCGGHNHMHALGTKSDKDGFGFGLFCTEHALDKQIAAYCERHELKDLAVYGELCGPKIQKNPHGLERLGFYVFDIAIEEDWQNWERVIAICGELNLQTVPVDHTGVFNLDQINAIIEQRSQFGDDCPREGVVVKFLTEDRFENGERGIFKHKPENRQERKSHRGKLVLSAEEIAYQNLSDTVADYLTAERAEHAVSHLLEAGSKIDFPSVVRELQADILKEADPSHRTEFLSNEKDFRKVVGKLVGKSHACKRVIFAAMAGGGSR